MERQPDEITLAHNQAAAEHWAQKKRTEMQQWGESILPILEDTSDPERENKISCLEFLITTVEQGNNSFLTLIQNLQAAALESTRSWYTERLGSISAEEQIRLNQRDFLTLYSIYKAGKD